MKYLPALWLLVGLTLIGCLDKIVPGSSDEVEVASGEESAGSSDLYKEKLALRKQLKELQAASKIDMAKE